MAELSQKFPFLCVGVLIKIDLSHFNFEASETLAEMGLRRWESEIK